MTKEAQVLAGVPFSVVSKYGESGQRIEATVSSSAWNGAVSRVITDVDSLLRPRNLSAPGGGASITTYNPDQQPLTITHPTGTTSTRLRQTFTYTLGDQLASNTANYGADALSWSYQYDALGRLDQLAQGEGVWAGVRTAEYDAAGRLNHWIDYRTVELPGQWICPNPNDESSCYMYYGTESQIARNVTYTYDAVGNRTDLSAVVQPGDRLTSFNGFTMTYDDDGNLWTKTGPNLNQSFVWNALGQLVQVTTNGTVTVFGYDGLGRRVRKQTANNVAERYIYDGDNLVVQTDIAGNKQLEFSYYPGVDRPHAVRKSSTGEIFWYGTSQPGNVTALVNSSNQVVNRYEYTPFGETISATVGVVQPFRFAGREFDIETGLYYNRARYYDPSLGRFISEDPIGLAGGVNQYAYAANDPVNQTDPSGLDWTGVEGWDWPFSWETFLAMIGGGGPHSVDDSGGGGAQGSSTQDAKKTKPLPACMANFLKRYYPRSDVGQVRLHDWSPFQIASNSVTFGYDIYLASHPAFDNPLSAPFHIFHEYTHVRQYEAGTLTVGSYVVDAAKVGFSHDQIPVEIQADRNASVLANLFPRTPEGRSCTQ